MINEKHGREFGNLICIMLWIYEENCEWKMYSLTFYINLYSKSNWIMEKETEIPNKNTYKTKKENDGLIYPCFVDKKIKLRRSFLWLNFSLYTKKVTTHWEWKRASNPIQYQNGLKILLDRHALSVISLSYGISWYLFYGFCF